MAPAYPSRFWKATSLFGRMGSTRAASSSPSSPREERAGRGPRRGGTNKNAPPLPGPLLHQTEEREKSRSLMQPWGSTGDPLPKALGTTRRTEAQGGFFQKASLSRLRARSPFRPASRRAVQASGPVLPKNKFPATLFVATD